MLLMGGIHNTGYREMTYKYTAVSGVPRGGGLGGSPLPEIPKALQNCAKLNPIVKTVKNC